MNKQCLLSSCLESLYLIDHEELNALDDKKKETVVRRSGSFNYKCHMNPLDKSLLTAHGFDSIKPIVYKDVDKFSHIKSLFHSKKTAMD